jgi:glycosyltransferase involved in cell wall biosynthesis
MTISNPLIVMPAFNEAESIHSILGEIHRVIPQIDVLVVDDGSSDDTATIAKSFGVFVMKLPFNLGVGGAMRAGFRFALNNNYDAVIQIDSDGQHDPIYVPELLNKLNDADIVIGARFAGQGTYKVSVARKLAMKVLSTSLSAICRTKLTDTTSGFKAMGPRSVQLFASVYPVEYLGDTVEALVIASRANLKVTQVPVVMRERHGGEPSQSSLKAVIYLGRAFVALIVGLSKSKKGFSA